MKYYARLLFALTLLLLVVTVFPQTPTPKPGQTAAAATTTGGDLPKPKIALLNSGAFADGIGELKVLYDKMNAEFAPRIQELSSMKSAIDAKQKQLDDNGAKMTPQQIRKLHAQTTLISKYQPIPTVINLR